MPESLADLGLNAKQIEILSRHSAYLKADDHDVEELVAMGLLRRHPYWDNVGQYHCRTAEADAFLAQDRSSGSPVP
jgi:hypothetical protein